MIRKAAMALVAAALGVTLTVGSAFAAPATATSPAPAKAPAAATKNDVTGTIKNWKADSFELQGAKGRPWKFNYDKTAKVTGTAANGAKAEVLYMDKSGKHWAKEVKVQ